MPSGLDERATGRPGGPRPQSAAAVRSHVAGRYVAGWRPAARRVLRTQNSVSRAVRAMRLCTKVQCTHLSVASPVILVILCHTLTHQHSPTHWSQWRPGHDHTQQS